MTGRMRRAFHLLTRRRGRPEEEVDDEIRLHIELRIEQLEREGLAPAAAREAAMRRFGLLGDARHILHDAARRREAHMARTEWIGALRHDLTFALRQLRRTPLFTVAAMVVLALGIGANATMFGVVDRLVLRGPAYVTDADDLVRLYVQRRPGLFGSQVSPVVGFPSYRVVHERLGSATDVAAFMPTSHIVGEGEAARPAHVMQTTGNYFRLLGVRPVLGRLLTPEDDRMPAGEPVVVLGYGFWQSRLGGAENVVGSSIALEGQRYTVVGVAPLGFTGVDFETVDVFVPLSAIRMQMHGARWHEERFWAYLRMVARVREGVAPVRVAEEATAAMRAGAPDTTDFDYGAKVLAGPVIEARGSIQMTPGFGGGAGSKAMVATWLAGVAAVVLLIACANVANLLLLRGIGRRREIAVRIALGVGRGRLIRQLLTESTLLALVGGAAALLIARWGGAVVRTVLLPDVDWSLGVIDRRVLLFTVLATTATALLMGLFPALQLASADVAHALRSGVREGGAVRSRLRPALLLVQTALSVLLLVGAGLFVRSLHRVSTLEYGYDPERVLFADATMADDTPALKLAAYDRMLERAKTLPGVERAALTTTSPFYSAAATDFVVPGFDSLAALRGNFPLVNGVSSGYFETMGTHLLRGRSFTDADAFGAPRVVIVNEAMARRIWKDQDAMGRCMKVGGDTMPCSEIVGIAQNSVQNDLREPPALVFYVPLAQRQTDNTMRSLVMRTKERPEALVATTRRALTGAAPGVRYLEVHPLQEHIDPQVRPWKLGATMFGVFGALALVIAAVGLYSIMAYEVAQRAHEIGVRVALGARRSALARLVLGRGLRVAMLGLALGGAVAWITARWVAPLLFGVDARDPLTYGIVAVTLLAAAALATLLPALRATRVDPLEALKSE